MASKYRNEFEESPDWSLLGQVGAIAAALGIVIGIGLGSASHASAPESAAAKADVPRAVTRFDHSRIAASIEPEAPPATF
jgi:hypothetical protein